MFNLPLIYRALQHYQDGEVSKEISDNETMINEWYFEVGQSAVECVFGALATSYTHKIERILDLPCGHGRVLRHLMKAFPDAKFDACDLDTDGLDYCAKTFGAKPILSKPDLTQVDFGAQYDLIWVGSLFTHVPEEETTKWLNHLAKFLTSRGVVVATFHGRFVLENYKNFPYIGQKSWDAIVRGYEERGYGYADYTREENHEYIESGYGISLSRPETIMKIVSEIPGVRLYSYTERAWADHQDVLVYGRPGVLETL